VISKIKSISGSNFVKNVVTVASGTAAAQAITMAFTPVITRLYGPEAYGVQGLFLSLLNMLLPLAIMGYPTAIVLPKEDRDAVNIIKLTMIVSISVALMTIIVLFVAEESLLNIFSLTSLGPLIYLLAPAVVFGAMSESLKQWLIRERAFGVAARFQVVTAFIVSSAKCVLGIIVPNAISLVLTTIVGGLVGTLLTVLGWSKWRKGKGSISASGGKKIAHLIKEYRDFPLYRTPQHFINTLSQSMPVLMLASGFGAASAGQYSIAISLLAVPAALIGNSVVSVFYPRITAACYRGENVRGMILKATGGMALVGFIPYMAVVAIGPDLFQFVFGNEWRKSGQFSQWLALWLFMNHIHRPAASAIPALGLNKSLLLYEIISSAGKILALSVGVFLYQSDSMAVALFSLAGFSSYVLLILWIIWKSPTGK